MINILCYGDSNTHGTMPIDFDLLGEPFVAPDYRYPKDKRWTTVLQKELGDEYFVIEEGLNGRTTVLDDPIEGIHKNGSTYLLPCLESHAPIDLVIVTLGTNDLKSRFSLTAFEIAQGIGVLVNIIRNSGCSPDGGSPGILIVCPPPLGKLTHLSEMLIDSGPKSFELDRYYSKVAKLNKCHYFNLGEIIETSERDGVHYEEGELAKIGKGLAVRVKEIFSN